MHANVIHQNNAYFILLNNYQIYLGHEITQMSQRIKSWDCKKACMTGASSSPHSLQQLKQFLHIKATSKQQANNNKTVIAF